MVSITEKSILFQGSRGGPTFSRGGGGVQMLISIETQITCDIPGGGGPDPLSPLWIRTCSISVKLLTEHHFEFLSLNGGCAGSSESTLVKI